MRIIIVEDYIDLLQVMMLMLQHVGHEVRGVRGLTDLDTELVNFRPHVLILDAMLPDGDGFEVAERLGSNPGLSIIMLTARCSEIDRMRGLNGGAAHYLVKPVGRDTLLQLLEHIQQRVAPDEMLRHAQFVGWTLDGTRQSLLSPMGVEVQLTRSEFQLLGSLMLSPGEAVARAAIIRALGHDPAKYDERRLHVAVSRLRRKLLQSCEQHIPIRAQWGVGYLFAGSCRLLECPPHFSQ